MRTWEGGKVSLKDADALDFSSNKPNSNKTSTTSLIDESSLGSTLNGTYEAKELDGHSESEEDTPTKPSGLYSFFQTLTGLSNCNKLTIQGQKLLSEKELNPCIQKMKEHLINKNVAADVSTILCDSVSKNLLGTRLCNSSINPYSY